MDAMNTPWLSACDSMQSALDWLCDIDRIRGAARDQAIEQACASFDAALSCLDRLADPSTNATSTEQFALTRARVADIAAPVRAGLPAGTRFRRVELRDIATQCHADRRRTELASVATRLPARAGMSCPKVTATVRAAA